MSIAVPLSTAALLLLSLSCIASNSVVCYIIYKKKIRQPIAVRYFIFSLAVTDLIVGAVDTPFYAILMAVWFRLDSQQQAYSIGIFGFIDIACLVASVIHLCMISIDRAVAIGKPLIHRAKVTRGTVMKLLTIPWITSIVAALPYIFVIQDLFLYFVYMHILAVVFYVLPILIIATSYIYIIHTLRNRKITDCITRANRVNDRKLIRTFLIVILAFVLCWTPFIIASRYILTKAYIEGYWPKDKSYYGFIKFATYLNSTLNPFIYAVTYPQFQIAIKEVLRNLLTKMRMKSNTLQDTRCDFEQH